MALDVLVLEMRRLSDFADPVQKASDALRNAVHPACGRAVPIDQPAAVAPALRGAIALAVSTTAFGAGSVAGSGIAWRIRPQRPLLVYTALYFLKIPLRLAWAFLAPLPVLAVSAGTAGLSFAAASDMPLCRRGFHALLAEPLRRKRQPGQTPNRLRDEELLVLGKPYPRRGITMKSSTRIAWRALAAAAFAGAVALATGVPGASAVRLSLTSARTASAAVPRCATTSLEVWLGLGAGSIAAGNSYYPLEFSNVSTRTCTLHGYPGVSAIGTNGTQLGSAAGQNPASRPQTVTLTPGATVHTVLQITNVSNYPPNTCKPATAIRLRVYPPNQTSATEVAFGFRACSAKGPVYLYIEAIQPKVGIPGRL